MDSVKKNFIYDAVYQILILIIPFLTTPYIARIIGVDGVGIYSYTYSIVNYFMMFALLGMNNYGNREISKCKDDKIELSKTFWEIYTLQFLITLIVTILYVGYIYFFSPKYLLITLIQGIYLISVFLDINWLFCGLQEFKITITRSAFIKILTLILIFTFVKDEGDLWKYILIMSSMTLLNQLVLWPFLRKKISFVKINIKNIKRHIKPTIILFIPVIATSIFKVMDKIMIGNISSVTEVGYYENSEKMLNIILSVVSALGTVTLPQMTYLYNNNKIDEYKKIFSKSISFLIFIVLPVIAGFLVTSNDLVYLYLGESFQKSSIILKILSISLLFSPIASIIRMQVLIPQSRDKQYIISVIAGATINFILNLFLIPYIQSIGAAISTVLAEGVVFFIEIYYIRNEFTIVKDIKNIFRFFISSLYVFFFASLIGIFVDNIIIRLLLQIIVGLLSYIIGNLQYIKTIIKSRG